ncbi:hypothetical protein AB1K83_13530 [Sporosarcina sp. 179-K 3D1 HS]|uniref:hypothetical protein n=1 Tax=Sporosarcina sp. 179-K 3D1 HS TaxID=3232169 RepID=UPI0039A03054
MEYITVTLVVVGLVCIGILFVKVNNHLMKANQYVAALQEQHNQQLEAEIESLSKFYEQRFKEQLASITSTYTNDLEKKLDKLDLTIKQSLHSYLTQEQYEMHQWIELINNESNHAQAIQQVESALNKFPGSSELIELYTKRITPYLESSEQPIQKLALERYNRATRVFLDNCQPSMWKRAKQLHNEALELGNRYMKSKVQQFEIQAEQIISVLETITSAKSLSPKQLERVEKLDNRLQKDLLKNFKGLHARYNKVTQRLFSHLSPSIDQKAVNEYNLNAIQQFKSAQELFTQQESSFKQGIDLARLSNLLGCWDQTYLTPPTQLYFQNVYSDIFAKLNPEVKPEMTKLMLKTTKKTVYA